MTVHRRDLHNPRLYSPRRLYYLLEVQCSGLFLVLQRAQRVSPLASRSLPGFGMADIFSVCVGDLSCSPAVQV